MGNCFYSYRRDGKRDLASRMEERVAILILSVLSAQGSLLPNDSVISEYFPSGCPDSEGFRCPVSSVCIEEHRFCDGIPDCPKTELDEDPGFCRRLKCSKEEGKVRCPGDSGTCLPFKSLCDGKKTCPDGSDEGFCFHRLFRGCFIPNSSHGDSDLVIADCVNCFCYLNKSVEPNFGIGGSYKSLNSERICLDKKSSLVCDGTPQCIDGRDEDPDLCFPNLDLLPASSATARSGRNLDGFHSGVIKKSGMKDNESEVDSKEFAVFAFMILTAFGFVLLIFVIVALILGIKKRKMNDSPSKILEERNLTEELEDARSTTTTEMTEIYSGIYISEVRDRRNSVNINSNWNWNLSTLVREIGRGFYGRVFLVKDETGGFVAVKTAERDRTCVNALSRLKEKILNNEIDILLESSGHENIIKLLAYNRASELIVLEFCHKGNLLNFITENRSNYIDEIDTKTEELNSEKCYYSNTPIISSTHSLPRSLKIQQAKNLSLFGDKKDTYEHIGAGDAMLFNTRRLLKWAHQIAKGMKFLESRKIIHGDLALRNILLTKDDVAQISDFGLASKSDDSENLKSLTEVEFSKIFSREEDDRMKPVPVAWMPVEFFHHEKNSDLAFVPTHYTDVWSFGVTLYEIFTLGSKPYEEISLSSIGSFLVGGQRLELPKLAPKSFRTLVASCWNETPSLRPDFDSIVQSFHLLLEYSGKRRNRRGRAKFQSISEMSSSSHNGRHSEFIEDNVDLELEKYCRRSSGYSSHSVDGYIPMSSRGNTPPVHDYVYWKGYKIMSSNPSLTG